MNSNERSAPQSWSQLTQSAQQAKPPEVDVRAALRIQAEAQIQDQEKTLDWATDLTALFRFTGMRVAMASLVLTAVALTWATAGSFEEVAFAYHFSDLLFAL